MSKTSHHSRKSRTKRSSIAADHDLRLPPRRSQQVHIGQTPEIPSSPTAIFSERHSTISCSAQPIKQPYSIVSGSKSDRTVRLGRIRLLVEPVGGYSSKQHQGRKPETTNTPSRQPDKLQHQRKTQHRGGTRSRSGHNRIRERGQTPPRSFHLGPHVSHSKQGTAGSILADFSRRHE